MLRLVALFVLVTAGSARAERVRDHEVGHQRLVLGDPNDDFIAAGRSLPRKRGVFDVIVHGNPNSVAIKRKGVWRNFSATQLARLIRHAGWNGRDPIRLLSCEVGKGKASFAERLSQATGAMVIAPKGFVMAYFDGTYEITKTYGGERATGHDRFVLFGSIGR